jgi:hypothetical protein
MSASVETHSRRALLGAALGAVAATVAGALGRPVPARANDPDDVVLGHANSSIGTTRITITSTSPSAVAFVGAASAGTGLHGSTTSGTGVFGQSGSGVGVVGQSTSGPGVTASSSTGYGLVTAGRIQIFTSGIAFIPSGSKQTFVVPGVDVTDASFILLTPQFNLGGRNLWYRLDKVNNRFTIVMSSARTGTTRVSWLLLG